MSGPRIGSLFSGYGGLDMGVQAVLGGDLAWVADIDPGACAILAHHHPDVPNLGDVSTTDWATVEPVDVLTGGTPCQDLSHAGRRAGMTEGTRSNLWVAMREAIAQLRPGLVIWENVRGAYSAAADSDLVARPGLLDSVRRRDDREPILRALGRVLGDLSDLGYDAVWHGLRAADVGAPHSRFRVFVTAWPTSPHTQCPGRGGAWHPASGEASGGWASAVAGRSGGAPADLTLLPTPTAADSERSSAVHEHGNPTLIGALLPTHAVHALLPTPRASDGEKGGPNQRGSSGDLMLPSAVALLPTPKARDWKGDASASAARNSPDLSAIERLLPTPTAADSKASGGGYNGQTNVTLTDAAARQPDRWGEYAAAIHRWEGLIRPAPEPTQPSSKGKPQLAPAFVEFMMGLPAGHVTDPGIYADLTDRRGKPLSASAIRNLQLRALGNGVVPQQAAAAVRWGLTHAHLEVSA